MSTELGAFAVLSSLLFYLTDLIPNHSQLQSKKVTWLKNIENKVNLRQECPSAHSGIRPTKFQLLQSRFMNNNREPYRKKSRDVGKLIIKEKTNRNVLNSIVSKLDRRSSTEEESPKITFQEKARWVSTCGKNTVKNVLKKFLAAEEKEAKERQGTLKKKAPNNDQPKIHKKNSVLSILKEKFEQTSKVCSAVDVKALLPCKDEKKNKKGLEKKAICKAEIRVLEINLRTATRFNSPQPQQLVCMTVTMPTLCVATEISHPWSLSTNTTHTPQISDHNPKVQGAKDTQRTQDLNPDKNSVPDSKAHGGQQKSQLQNKCHEISTVVTDQNDIIANDATSANPGSNQDSISSSKNPVPLAGHIPNLPQNGLDHKESVTSPADNPFSSSEDKNTNQSPTSSSSSPAEGISAHSHQKVKGDQISSISERKCRPEERETELTETTREPPFASQKCFPEQKVLENIPPLKSPAAQASCNTEGLPVNNQQSSVEPAAVDKMPQLKPSQGNEQDLRSKICDAAQNKEKLPDKKETDPTCIENDHINQIKKEAETSRSRNKESDLQIESEHLFLKTQTQQNKQNNTSPTKETLNQAFQFPTTSNSQKNKNKSVKETHNCNDVENHHFPFSSGTERSSCATAVEDIGKTKVCSVNAVTSPQCNSAETNVSVSELETSKGLLKELFSHETHTLEESSGPLSEKCHLSTVDHSATSERNIAEVNRPWCGIGNFQIPSSNGSSNNESCIQGNKADSHNSGKHHVPSLNELQKPKAAPGLDDKIVCNFHSDLIESKNSAARDKNILPKMPEKKHQPSSTENVRKYEDSPTDKKALMHNMKKQELPLGNNTGKQGEAQVMAEGESEKSSLPSQNETAGVGKSAIGKGNLPEGTQCLIPSSVNRREQENIRAEEQSPVTSSKKTMYNSKMPPKSIKNDFTKESRDVTETNLPQAEQLAPPKSNNKRAKTDVTKDGDTKQIKISQTQQLAPPKSDGKQGKTDLTKDGDKTETNISHTCKMTPTKNNNKQAESRSIEDDGDTTAVNSSQTQQLTLPKNKTSRRGVFNSPDDSRYQTPPSDPAKCDSVKVEDGNIRKHLFSPFKISIKHDGASREGRNAKDKIQDDKMPSSVDKMKPESKIEKTREQTIKSKRKALPLKSEHPKSKETSISEGNILGKKDKMNNLVVEQQKPSFNYPRKPDIIAKDEKQAVWNSKKDQLLRSHRNKIPEGKQQQQFQAPKDRVSSKSSLRDEQHTHDISEKYNLASLDEPEGHKNNSPEKKGPSKNSDKQRVPQLNQDRTFQKTLYEADMDPQLGTSKKFCTSEHRKAEQSFGKYQIPSARDLSRHEGEETKKSRAGVVQESKISLVGLEKYKAESYSEGPRNLSFKPMVIRMIDTIKLDN
uniref:Uncharacterized protein n=1 Tax=Pogona vitticeps TaxID=103695 RepID=A0ABM5FVE2_9SAUR